MNMPGYTAEFALGRTQRILQSAEASVATIGGSAVLPQMGFGVGVTYPPPDDDECLYCVQWVRMPC